MCIKLKVVEVVLEYFTQEDPNSNFELLIGIAQYFYVFVPNFIQYMLKYP